MPTSGVFSRASRVTVLFVEDDADLRFVYQSLAAGEGIVAELADSGYEAILLANLFLPDVIVLDRGLPDLDGLEVARRLRASASTADIPIVIASGDDSHETEAAVRAAGCDAHLLKPFSGDDLLQLIGVLVTRSRDPEPIPLAPTATRAFQQSSVTSKAPAHGQP